MKHPLFPMALSGLLMLGACGGSETPQAAAGDLERFAAQMDRDEAAAKARGVADAETRAKVRADEASERIAKLERETAMRD